MRGRLRTMNAPLQALRYHVTGAIERGEAVPIVAVRWRIRMDKYRATWNWFTTNPQGGGFGSNHCGTKAVALASAVRCIPAGEPYELVTNGKSKVCIR